MPFWLRVVLAPYLWVMRVIGKLDMPHRLQHHIQHTYVPLLEKALKWRYFTIAAGLAILFATVGYVAGRIPFTFLPKVEGDLITAHLKMPVGTPVSETERIADRIASNGPLAVKAILATLRSTETLSEEEAFVIDLQPPECEYWNLQIGNHWLESLDYRFHRIHVNKHTARYREDGSVRIVVAHRDPGVPNWLDAAGLEVGVQGRDQDDHVHIGGDHLLFDPLAALPFSPAGQIAGLASLQQHRR